MTEHYVARRPSIVDKVTPLMNQAWVIEHEVVGLGYSPIKSHYQEVAHELRREDYHNKIQELFAYSDDQNYAIELGIDIKQHRINIPLLLTSGTEMIQDLDYSLIQHE